MANSVYVALTRQSGLMKEMQVVANNVANAATTGYRSEGVIFAEHVKSAGRDQASISMASAEGHRTEMTQGKLSQTGGKFDLAIEGEGFFQIQTPAGVRLTRAGAFIPTPEGDLATPDGYRLLDQGGAPLFVPADAGDIAISSDGTLSADGAAIAQIGLVRPEDPTDLIREDGVRFRTEGELIPVEDTRILQGFLEGSNVDPVGEIARMIQVQRAYEMGQAFLEREDERLRSVASLITK
ncbi:flagellar hook-basal body complex protein [Litoreibacter roseus]|uniref:Flagellar basal-body rod protein FlgF n=1 Tax=Litoreibacter roseus TaxID=2601869 RepID=A0A6N6JDI1_9RHOB|nr:flagellar hook-basal body complex protein [Litoreibacter roseus]GFE64411.1 flagellar basal-body rod protein FlgF [Litoreibacter roseus]